MSFVFNNCSTVKTANNAVNAKSTPVKSNGMKFPINAPKTEPVTQ